MAIDEAAQSSTPKGGAFENAPTNDAPTGDNVAADSWAYHLKKNFSYLFFFFFFICFENNIFCPVFIGFCFLCKNNGNCLLFLGLN